MSDSEMTHTRLQTNQRRPQRRGQRRDQRRGNPLCLAYLFCLASLFCSGSLLVAARPAAATATPAADHRVIAVGDIHGAYDGFVEILRESGLIDEEQRWIGGASVLVQTGDLYDRGPKVRQVVELVMRLEEEAALAGGRVVSLLGNHEVNNLIGYLDKNSTPAEVLEELFSSYTTDSSEKRRQETYRSWSRWQRRYKKCGSRDRGEWMRTHPPGFVEYFETLRPTGDHGAWLRSLPTVQQLDGTVFVHGGLSPKLAEYGIDSLEEVNERVRSEIAQWDSDLAWLIEQEFVPPVATFSEVICALAAELTRREGESEPTEVTLKLREIRERQPSTSSWLSLDPDGPLWFRGFAKWSDDDGQAEVAAVARTFQADRFVVGHTPQRGQIGMRFDGTVFLIDTGLVYGAAIDGRGAALEISPAGIHAIYAGERQLLLTATGSKPAIEEPEETGATEPSSAATLPRHRWLDRDGQELPFENLDAVRTFLRTAPVGSVDEIPVGSTNPKRLTLQQGELSTRAAFRHLHDQADRKRLSDGKVVMFFRDSYANEVAAFELATLLGMKSVPPAVVRDVNGTPGSVQLWIENVMMERERRERNLQPPDASSFDRQMTEMRVFDNLINNIDRNQGNMLIDDQWSLWLIDHTRSFGRDKQLPSPEKLRSCSRSFWKRLRALDESTVFARLSPYLGRFEIQSVLARRKKVIAHLEQRIEELGVERVLLDY